MKQNASLKDPIKQRHRKPENNLWPKLNGNPVISIGVWPFTAVVVAIYCWGWVETFPLVAAALCAVTAVSESFKTQLGSLSEEAFLNGRWMRGLAFAFGGLCCLAWGVASGVATVHAMGEPKRAYDATQSAVTTAKNKVERLQAQLVALPQPTESMPASRIKEMEAANATKRADIGTQIADAKADLAEAKRDAATIKKPGAGLDIPWQAKVAVTFFVEFLLFGVPWANNRPERPVAAEVKAKPTPPKPQPAPKKINDGGWDKRRLRYGPSGRRTPLRLVTA